MVISVSHLTDQVEITGGGHARILSAARGPAFPPAGPPTPVAASDSCTLTPLRGYDDPFQFHDAARLQIAKRYRIIALLQSHNFNYKLRGILNAQACECCSAEGKAGSPYAGNGGGGYHIYGGRRTSATETIGSGGLANTDGHDPPGEAHR